MDVHANHISLCVCYSLFINDNNHIINRYCDPQHLHRIRELGAFEKIMDFILWTAEYHSELKYCLSTKDIVEKKRKKGKGKLRRTTKVEWKRGSLMVQVVLDKNFNQPMKLLFDLFRSIVHSLKEDATKLDDLNATIMSILLDLFDTDIRQNALNSKARMAIR
jgi:hypothetical protein